MSGVTLGEALRSARQRIDPVDARALLCHVLERNPAYLIAHPDGSLSPEQAGRYRALVARRAAGEPVAYLTGEREFYGRLFRVTPAVLIPRPETELLVDLALERIAPERSSRVLDLGTGSGCAAITIASERSHCEVLAVDQSVAALAVAKENACRLGVRNARFLRSDWFSEVAGEHFDLVLSNPPYIPTRDLHLDRGDLRFEPRGALAAGSDGLNAIRAIVEGACHHLVPAGWLLLEHGYNQARDVRNLLLETGYEGVLSVRDLAGIERVSAGRLTAAAARQ